MIGLLRFVLAMLVVIAHLVQGSYFFSHFGIFAVFGFYIISGFLMAYVLNETYSFKFFSFACNRFLRLFPIYYFVALCSAILIWSIPGAAEFHPKWTIQYRLEDALGNGLIFPFAFYDSSFRIVPPMWSVAIELINYFFLWLFVARSSTAAFASIGLALVYHVYAFSKGMYWGQRFYPFYAALLPFSLGAVLFFLRHEIAALPEKTVHRIASISIIIWLLNLCICGIMDGLFGRWIDLFFYMNLISLVFFIACYVSSHHPFPQVKKLGKPLGDLAYPIFLCHWIVAFGISLLFFKGQHTRFALVVVSVIPILAVSFCLARLANLFEPYRNKIRNSATSTRP